MNDIPSIVRKGFASIGNVNLKSDDTVVIKPNLCCIKGPETGATTDPRVVEGIIEYLRNDIGISSIFVVESDGTQLLADMAFKLLGYERLSKRLNIKLINLSKASYSVKKFDDNVFLKKIRVPHVLEEADCIISVPKIKIHDLCSFTATMKNQFGCNPRPRKIVYHKRMHDSIVDLNVAFRPHLVVVDGIVAMEGNGPIDGIPVIMNTLIFGRDPVAVDHLIARIMGINPRHVEYLVQAQKRGIGTIEYETVGTNLGEINTKFMGPTNQRNLYRMFSRDHGD